MRSIILAIGLFYTPLIANVFPGMNRTLATFASIKKRDPETPELLADLRTLPDIEPTPVGKPIKSILLLENTTGDSQDLTTVYKAPGPLESPEWPTGRCNDFARQAVRLGFHDAGTWSKTQRGGADGSSVLAGEASRPIDRDLEEINNKMWEYYHKFHKYGAGMADLIQMGATVGAVGRNDSLTPAPEGRLPGDLIALLGAHTIGQQRFEDPARAGGPHDTTPGRIFKFHSDVSIALYNASLPLNDQANDFFVKGYSATCIRLSLLGVPHINNLIECTGVLPLRIANYTAPDEAELAEWLDSDRAPMREEAALLMNGESLKKEL
ncbi:heme peroxidase [Lojkania enalia]|uniref:Heme peroxidase n=1 Tax=Lojkania enalia TaxID=147567 RepID=A0A9P4NAQ1_9PLEO|nr:heme peroxidase [Didymosphaeria enalia]